MMVSARSGSLIRPLFALQRPEIPLAFRTGIIEDLPGSASFVSQTSRFVIWVVVFDVSDAVPGWSMDGYVRWYNVNRGSTRC